MTSKYIHDLPTPALMLHLPTADHNIQKAAAFVEGKPVRLRPHFKNNKCVTLARRQLAAGGCVGMTVATVREARALVNGGVDNILIANQVVGDAKVAAVADLAGRAQIRLAVDALENAEPISAAATQRGVTVGVLIEVDIGMSRCGVAPGEEALALARQLVDLPGLRFDGLQAYEGNAIRIVDRAEREAEGIKSMQKAIDTRRLLESNGFPCAVLSGSGTGTYHVVGNMDGIDELQIGSYVTMDVSYKERVGDGFDNALTVLASVVSAHGDRAVLDVGSKGVGHEFGPPAVMKRPDLEIGRFGAEEHTVLRGTPGSVRVGDRIHLIPSHCCSTCNLYREMVVHDGEQIIDIWPIEASGYSLE